MDIEQIKLLRRGFRYLEEAGSVVVLAPSFDEDFLLGVLPLLPEHGRFQELTYYSRNGNKMFFRTGTEPTDITDSTTALITMPGANQSGMVSRWVKATCLRIEQ